jgi:hypothetical protein
MFRLLRRGDGDVMTELRRHKVTHIAITPYIAYGWQQSIEYLMTIKRSLIGGFPQARLAGVINRLHPIGPGNYWTTQSLQVRPLLKHDVEDRRSNIFDDHVFCIFKKELMKYVVLKYVCMFLLALQFIFISCLRFVFTMPVGHDSPPIFAALQWSLLWIWQLANHGHVVGDAYLQYSELWSLGQRQQLTLKAKERICTSTRTYYIDGW